MIVHPTNNGWEIIHQQAHGLLAFQIAMHWQAQKRSTHWIETLTALVEHDDGQDPFEGKNHISNAGAPLQFKPYSVEQCHQIINIALKKSRWNALMVSHHTSFLYEVKRGEDAELDAFLDQQKESQTKWRKEYGVTQKEVTYAYNLVQWCDALSLILCLEKLPSEERLLEISKDPEGTASFIHKRKADKSLCVDPWPFDTDEFTVHIEVYPVNQLSFKDDDELNNAINNAVVETREWVFRK